MTKGEPYDKGVRKNQLSGSYGDFQPVHVASDGDRYPTDIVYIKTAECEGEVVHPTQKPIELGRYFIRTYSNPGDVILDNQLGRVSNLYVGLQLVILEVCAIGLAITYNGNTEYQRWILQTLPRYAGHSTRHGHTYNLTNAAVLVHPGCTVSIRVVGLAGDHN